ncbi:hypothetical protein D3C76_191420 [compost metagenome]
MLKIYTSNIKYSKGDVDRYDITVKSGDTCFSPTWDMLIKIKSGEISRQEYKKQYIEQMRKSKLENPEKWKKLIERERVVLVCYCPSGVFCHRVLLAKMLEISGVGKYEGEIEI